MGGHCSHLCGGGSTGVSDLVDLHRNQGLGVYIDQAISVTSLGWWDYDADGLAASHQVGIWNTAGTLLLSATVASGTADPLIDRFRFNSPLSGSSTLAAGNYVIGGLSTVDDYTAGNLVNCCGESVS